MSTKDNPSPGDWTPLAAELLAQAGAVLDTAGREAATQAETAAAGAATDVANAGRVLRKVPKDGPEHAAISAARDRARQAGHEAQVTARAHRQVVRGLLDDLKRLGGVH